MGETTGIAWTDATANFWWGCQRVSPGCEHCYAEQLAVVRRKLPIWGPPKTTERQRKKGIWRDIAKWNADAAREGRRLRVFVSSMADVFEDHPQVVEWRTEALALLETLTSLDVQLLTKRPQNVRAMVPPAWLTSWPAHIWIGTTIEDQKRADERVPELLKIPARVRFLSMEPLLEAVDLGAWIGDHDCRCGPECGWRGWAEGLDPCSAGARDECANDETKCEGHGDHCPKCGSPCHVGPVEGREELSERDRARPDSYGRRMHPIDWIIIGGESGPGARPFNLAWARSIVRQCDEAGVPVFVKQMGDNPICFTNTEHLPDEPHPLRFAAHHGANPSEWPVDLRRQEFPA